jgi:hypothetical protein
MNEELERLLELDPIKAHERIMQATRPPPMIIHKEYIGEQPPLPDNGDELPSLFSDEQIDVIAQAFADLRTEMRGEFQDMINDAMGPLMEQVAVMQGQMSVLLSLINTIVGNSNNSIKEASETKTKTVRRVRQTDRSNNSKRLVSRLNEPMPSTPLGSRRPDHLTAATRQRPSVGR